MLDGFSGHADRGDLAWWYEQTGGHIEHAFLVHGEPESMEALCPATPAVRQSPVRCPRSTRATRCNLACLGQPPGGHEAVAVADEVCHFLPVGLADVQPKADPSPRADIRRQVEPGGIYGRQLGVLAWPHFEANGDDAVAMVIVEEISERFLPHREAGVVSLHFERRFRESPGRSSSGESSVGRQRWT